MPGFLLCIADFARLMDFNLRQTNVFKVSVTNLAIAAMPADFPTLLRRVVFISQATLCPGLDF